VAVSTQVISHLIEQESKAETMLAEAQEEANKRIVRARAQAEEAYKSQYEKAILRFEESYESQIAQINSGYTAALESYRASLDTSKLDFAAFNDLLGKRLAGGVAPNAR
jgi:vacuolar-type H+-ATPase subunit H